MHPSAKTVKAWPGGLRLCG